MIEHTGFSQHGITHSSPSQINKWASAPDVWIAEKLFGHKFSTSAAAERGTAVEVGLVMMLDGYDRQLALDAALSCFDRATPFMDKREYERENIEPMLDMAYAALMEAGMSNRIIPSKLDNSAQEKVEILCRGDGWELPIMGYLDLRFADCIIDLKTTGRMPSVMSIAHQRQRALYAKATGLPVEFLYVTPKKAEFKEDGDVNEVLGEMKAILNRQERFLRVSPCKRLLAEIVPMTERDSMYWKNDLNIRKEVFGI